MGYLPGPPQSSEIIRNWVIEYTDKLLSWASYKVSDRNFAGQFSAGYFFGRSTIFSSV